MKYFAFVLLLAAVFAAPVEVKRVQSPEIDFLKCIINNAGPLCYKILDLIEAIEAQDIPNIIILAAECYDDGVNLYNQCFAEKK